MGVLDMNEEFVPFELAKKLKEKGYPQKPDNMSCMPYYEYDEVGNHAALCNEIVWHMSTEPRDTIFAAPAIHKVLKWLREGKNIDVEIHAEAGMLGNKVYVPFISTYTEFTLETSPDVVRYRQKKFNPTKPLPHEIVPAHVYFKEWEEAALAGIEFVIDNLI